MKKAYFAFCTVGLFLAEIVVLAAFAFARPDFSQDAVAVNEIIQSVKQDWGNLDNHTNKTGLSYVVLDKAGNVLYRSKSGLTETASAAVSHRDTIWSIEEDGAVLGRILVFNDSAQAFYAQKKTAVFVLAAAVLIQGCVCAGYFIYLDRTLVAPFYKLKGFAERIARGNLDIPLAMDRQNLFGVFTESFDLMRTELKKARLAEAEANAGKKELVARLSHDIKTPVASIKAASEVGYELSSLAAAGKEDLLFGGGKDQRDFAEKMKGSYAQIIQKADQINLLVTNLFTATLEELRQIPVTPADIESREIKELLENSDYLRRAVLPDIPDCLLFADKLRLQQVFDNIVSNSYKYADTKLAVTVRKENGRLFICIEDYGGGVPEEELPHLKEKFRRGSNARGIEGAGLGLFISDCFMEEMHGALSLENGENGLKATVRLALSGTI